MNLSFSEEDLKFQDEVRSFIAENYPADIKNKMDNGIPVSKDDIQTWQRILSKKGWFAVNWPEEYGGTGWSITQKHIFQNELADANTPTLVPFGVSMCGPVVYTFGTQEQKDRFLPGIINNDVWWCQGYSEPGSGSDLASLKTKLLKMAITTLLTERKLGQPWRNMQIGFSVWLEQKQPISNNKE